MNETISRGWTLTGGQRAAEEAAHRRHRAGIEQQLTMTRSQREDE
jgi:hypothetical protein